MKNSLLLVFFSFLVSTVAHTQDAYHQKLLGTFTNTFQIPTGNWLLFDNEAEIMEMAGGYGGSFSVNPSTDTDFSLVTKATISSAGANQWDSGWNIRNRVKINKGDKVLIIFSIQSTDGSGKANIFAENASTFSKEVFLSVDISEGWTHYFIPFESQGTYNTNDLSLGFHLGHQVQTLEIGGYTAMNFGPNVNLDDLPNQVNNDQYDGAAADAPWRVVAAERIENLRKADLTIQVRSPEGAAIEGVLVEIKMLRHEFAFGTAVNANKIGGNNAQNNIYQNKIINLDGKGHGFNWVVFENDLKWPAWEDNWFVDNDGVAKAVQWLRAQDIKIRGHALVWPGERNMPNDISANRNNLNYIKERIDGHLESILRYPGIAGEIEEWDVLNEITSNRSLENYFRGKEGYTTGREILAEICQKTRAIDANTGLWLNDYVTISTNSKPGNANYDNLKQFTRELIDAGVNLEGLGFQAHIGGFPNGIPSVLETLDDFHNEFGLKAKVTEFDMPAFVDAELAAKYYGDFLTAIFSHESMNGFLSWSFWDGATWIEGGTKSNFFQFNWTPNPSLETFTNLVFNEWWTEESLVSTESGAVDTRVFKGLYEISYEVAGETVRDTINIVENTNYEIIANNISTSLPSLQANEALANIYPNPAKDRLTIEKFGTKPVTIQLFDSMGKLIITQTLSTQNITIDTEALKGIYLVKVFDDTYLTTQKIIIQ